MKYCRVGLVNSYMTQQCSQSIKHSLNFVITRLQKLLLSQGFWFELICQLSNHICYDAKLREL